MSENYVNHYVEILTNTMTDAVVRNISLQANAKISEEVINSLQAQLQEMQGVIESQSSTENNRINELESQVGQLTNELNNYRNKNAEFENIKSQAQHVDTFRNELTKARKENETLRAEHGVEIDALKATIEYLQLTPAKRKKVDEEKAKVLESSQLPITGGEINKDGGTF
jgi:chromosome segregation ATPase